MHAEWHKTPTDGIESCEFMSFILLTKYCHIVANINVLRLSSREN